MSFSEYDYEDRGELITVRVMDLDGMQKNYRRVEVVYNHEVQARYMPCKEDFIKYVIDEMNKKYGDWIAVRSEN